MRKDNFATVLLPHDKWLAIFKYALDTTPKDAEAKESINLAMEQVMTQAVHSHGAGKPKVCDLEPGLCKISLGCPQCEEELWSSKVAYPPTQPPATSEGQVN